MGEATAVCGYSMVPPENWTRHEYAQIARIASALAARDATIAGLRADLDTERARAEAAERTCIAAIDSALEHTAALVRERDTALTRAATAEAEAATMRTWAARAAQAENENAEDARRERAAVVAWLNGCATEGFILLRINEACDAEKWALAIERGEHRREEAK